MSSYYDLYSRIEYRKKQIFDALMELDTFEQAHSWNKRVYEKTLDTLLTFKNKYVKIVDMKQYLNCFIQLKKIETQLEKESSYIDGLRRGIGIMEKEVLTLETEISSLGKVYEFKKR